MFIKAVLLLFLGTIRESWQFDFILPLKDHFYLNNPLIISKSGLEYEKEIFKEFSNQGEYVSFKKRFAMVPDRSRFKCDIIFIPSSWNELVHELNYLKPYQSRIITILDNLLHEEVLKKLELEINQEIYFLNSLTNEIFESYVINGIRIKRKLGNLTKSEFHWDTGINPSFIARRSNFRGLILTAFTEASGRDLMIEFLHSVDSLFSFHLVNVETDQVS